MQQGLFIKLEFELIIQFYDPQLLPPQPQPIPRSLRLFGWFRHDPPLNSPFLVNSKRTDKAKTAIITSIKVSISSSIIGIMISFV